jgi:hypothetical protein
VIDEAEAQEIFSYLEAIGRYSEDAEQSEEQGQAAPQRE